MERAAQRRAARLHARKITTAKPVVRISNRRYRTRTRRARSQRSVRDTTNQRLQQLKEAVIQSTNAERAKYNLPALTYNRYLEKAAQRHADDMQRRNYFSHETPEGVRPSQRMQSAGYGDIRMRNCNCRAFRVQFAENIAMGQDTVAAVMRDWMNSPSHREAILSSSLKEIGIGIAGKHWAQNFGAIEITPR